MTRPQNTQQTRAYPKMEKAEEIPKSDDITSKIEQTKDMDKEVKSKGRETRVSNSRAEEIARSADFVAKKEKSKAYLESVGYLDEHFDERMEEMAIDMAEREEEHTKELKQFERAGLSEKERELIPKLDENSNLCYKYMRDHNNNWQYDPEKIDTRYKVRLYRRFDTFDKDSDGIMTLNEVLSWADRMKTLCKTNDKEVEIVREALRSYFTMYGLGGDGLHRENWVEAHVTMGEAAKERKAQGDPIPMEMLANAYFDVIDENDDGLISMPELKKMMNVFRVPEEAAYPFFEQADINSDGSLERDEMHKLFYRFWFGEYNSELDHIFAYKY